MSVRKRKTVVKEGSTCAHYTSTDYHSEWSETRTKYAPGAEIQAQLIERGETPDVITARVTLTYAVDLEPGVGLTGSRLSDTVVLNQDRETFVGAA